MMYMRLAPLLALAYLACGCAADASGSGGSPGFSAVSGTGGTPAIVGGSGGIGSGGSGQGTGGATGVGVAMGTGGAGAVGTGGAAALGTGGVGAGTGGMSAGGTGGTTAVGTGGMAAGGTGGMAAGGTGGMAAGGSGGSGAAGSAGSGGCTQNLSCQLAAPASSGDIRQDCVDRINQFRTQCACLPPLQRWTDGEACADQMAQYDSTMPSSPHAGFMNHVCSGGSAQDECPGYGSNDQVIGLCLQQMWNEGPPPQSSCTGSCFQMYGHFINMTSTMSTKVACGFATNSTGQIWAVQNFSW